MNHWSRAAEPPDKNAPRQLQGAAPHEGGPTPIPDSGPDYAYRQPPPGNWPHFEPYDPAQARYGDARTLDPSARYPLPIPPAPIHGQGPPGWGTAPAPSIPPPDPFWTPPQPQPAVSRRRGSKAGTVVKTALGFVAIMAFFGGCIAVVADHEPVRAPVSTSGEAPVTADAPPTATPTTEVAQGGPPTGGEIVEAGTLSPADLQPGDCFTIQRVERPGVDRGFNTVEAVPCSAPHQDQLVAKITYEPTDGRLGVVANRAHRDCESEYKQKLTAKTLRTASISQQIVYPLSDEVWRATPIIACTVHSATPVTRSLLK